MADPIKISVQVNQPRLNITSPVGLVSGWPFGSNPNEAGVIARDIPTTVDRVPMPGQYRVVKWLLLITDDTHGLGVSSEINAFMRGGVVEFTEYAILGDAEVIRYEVDVVVEGHDAVLVLTSRYDQPVRVNTMKIGLFS